MVPSPFVKTSGLGICSLDRKHFLKKLFRLKIWQSVVPCDSVPLQVVEVAAKQVAENLPVRVCLSHQDNTFAPQVRRRPGGSTFETITLSAALARGTRSGIDHRKGGFPVSSLEGSPHTGSRILGKSLARACPLSEKTRAKLWLLISLRK